MLKTMIKIVLLTLGYRALGFIRDVMIAKKFGAGIETDAFFLAQSLPNLILETLAIGAFSTVLVPMLSEKKIKINEICGNFLLIFFFVSLSGIFFSEQIVVFLAPGFGNEQVKLATSLSKIFFIGMPFIILNEINSSILISKNRSVIISISNLLNNLCLVIISLCLLKIFGIKAFVYGVFFALIIKGIYLFSENNENFNIWSIKINLKNPDFYKTLILLFPVMISSIGNQVNFIIDRKIASTLSKGAISTLNYANKIIQLPLGIVLGALILSSFPLIVKAIQDLNDEEYKKLIQKKIEIILVSMLFITSFFIVYSQDIITIIYKRGSFTVLDMQNTSQILKFYAGSIITISFTTIFQRIFYANSRTKVPALISCLGVILNIILNIILSRSLGAKGLALATTLSTAAVALIMLIILVIEKKIFCDKKKTIQIILANILLTTFNFILNKENFFSNNMIIKMIVVILINTLIYGSMLIIIFKINLKKIIKIKNYL